MATHSWKAGDTERIEATLRDRGRAIPLVSGTLVNFHARHVAGGPTEVVACTITNADKGIVDFPPPNLFATAGIYHCEWEIEFSDGTQVTVPNGNGGDAYDTFEVRAGLA